MQANRLFHSLALASLTFITPALFAAPIPEAVKIGGFAVGCQAYTFNRFSAFEAVEKTAQAGGKCIEFYPGQRFSPQQPDLKMHHTLAADALAQLQAHLAQHGVRAVNYGVVDAKDEAEWRQIVEFARALGLYAINTEAVDHLDVLEKLAREFDICVAIHNHPRRPADPRYRVWDPEYVMSLVKDRDPRIGACADPGHWATSGIVPLDGIRTLRGRIISVHLKDRTAVGRPTEDVPFGAGISDIKGILDELKAQNFRGNIAIEYEAHWDHNVPHVAQCIGFFRGYATCR